MKKLLLIGVILSAFSSKATVHTVRVSDGYYKFIPEAVTIELGDTVQWLPIDDPSMTHTITSKNIPEGADSFDQIWQAPTDTFFQYVPQVAGLYEYVCTPHETSNDMIGSITVTDVATGVFDSDLKKDLSAYPNPANNKVYIDALGSKTAYHVYNLSGQLMLSGQTTREIDISSLKRGTYVIKIVGDRPRRMKVVKQ